MSDVVVRGEVPAAIRRSVELWIGCVAGALDESEYRAKLARVGFEAIEIEPTRVYRLEDATAEFARAVAQRCVDEGEDVPLWLADLLDNAREPASARFNAKPAEAAAT